MGCQTSDYSLEVSLKAQTIFTLFGFNVTNSQITMLLWMLVMFAFFFFCVRRARMVPTRWQALGESVIRPLLNMNEGSLGRRAGRRGFPLFATFFIFILFANWLSLLPGVGTIGFVHCSVVAATDKTQLAANDFATPKASFLFAGETVDLGTPFKVTAINGDTAQVELLDTTNNDLKFTDTTTTGTVQTAQIQPGNSRRVMLPLLRAPNADLNMTLGMALLAVILSWVVGLRVHGLGWFKEFFPKPYAADIILTPIEIISQFARIVSLTFRLFGNVLAGEVLVGVVLFLGVFSPFLIIFQGLELFAGFIQALVFSLLALIYTTLNYGGHTEGQHADAHAEDQEHLDPVAEHPEQELAGART